MPAIHVQRATLLAVAGLVLSLASSGLCAAQSDAAALLRHLQAPSGGALSFSKFSVLCYDCGEFQAFDASMCTPKPLLPCTAACRAATYVHRILQFASDVSS